MRKGFTLLELSIVLLIISLIIGGVMLGRSVIRTAELKDVIEEYNRYAQAVGEFRDKYNALPGDMINAQTYWGTNSGGCPDGDPLTKQRGTCNGNGNGAIGTSDSAGAITAAGEEWFTAWQHMANAGLIDGMYTGAKGPDGTSDADIGMNVPASTLKPAGWSIFYYQQQADGTSASLLWGTANGYGALGHVFAFGAAGNNTPSLYAVLTPTEAQEIDVKIDDGRPSLGKVRSPRNGTGYAPNCIDGDSAPATDAYKLSYTQAACPLLFIPGF